ncbi:hypothetical protein [Niabella drilacis]|uniref:Uncharacterized protein n=1 Tax=Niabella drilacis (strain DSM 25811 / CCM 8410 / CCUG 62505 / LMG 26954 / E90) TaxID=1285928 RepID=A0A1G6KXS4_NIADE|nr:hypothetical protein [Niabella drilacis]SDC35892.1 hypothetical protein SAMN04487894_102145 [Niabella drilacis]
MKKISGILLLMMTTLSLQAQRIERIQFNLYTDSLKKGTHNYINVDGKMSDGSWRPMTQKELKFSSDYGKFDGNSLVLPDEPSVKKVAITISLKDNPRMTQDITIWIKQKPDPPLPKYETNAPRRRR